MTPDRAIAAANSTSPTVSAQKNRQAWPAGSKSVAVAKDLGELHVRSLLAAPALVVLDLEGDLVALVQRRNAGALERGGMDEYVLVTALRRDKAEAARMIEEFHCAIDTRHWDSFPVDNFHIAVRSPRGRPASSNCSGKGRRARSRRDSLCRHFLKAHAHLGRADACHMAGLEGDCKAQLGRTCQTPAPAQAANSAFRPFFDLAQSFSARPI